MKNIGSVTKRRLPDIAGACVSIVCMIHCFLLPLLLTPYVLESFIPSGRLAVLESHTAHEVMLMCTITFGITSLYFAAREGKHIPVLCLALGLVSVTVAELLAHDLVAVRVPGTLCIAGGHLLAMRGCKSTCHS